MGHMLKVGDAVWINTLHIVGVGYDVDKDTDIDIVISTTTGQTATYAKGIASKSEANVIMDKLIRMIDQ